MLEINPYAKELISSVEYNMYDSGPCRFDVCFVTQGYAGETVFVTSKFKSCNGYWYTFNEAEIYLFISSGMNEEGTEQTISIIKFELK